MARKYPTTRKLVALSPSKQSFAPETVSTLDQKRSAVASSEDSDACLTGMTRSLDRRLLALNLQPIPPANQPGYMKVA